MYKWALGVAKPIRITEEQFLGNQNPSPIVPGYVSYTYILNRYLASLTYTSKFLDRFRISKIDYKNELPKGEYSYGVVVFQGDTQIALTYAEYLYVSPEFRGMGIASELKAEAYIAFPEVLISRVKTTEEKFYTPGGLAAMKTAYKLMVDRGAILKD